MQGTAAPLVTPFTADETIDRDALASVTEWLVDSGLDFLVATGSTGEAELLSAEERTTVIETVVESSGDTPVVAGTGHPGFSETMAQTRAAADAGAEAALVITPFYYPLDQVGLETYYRDVADASPIPIYLYSVPKFTDVRVEPETAIALAAHENVAGMKDSSGDLVGLQRIASGTAGADFDLLVGSGGLLAPGLDAGASGGILALANVVPELVSEIFEHYAAGRDDAARGLNRDLVELNRAVTATYGVPGVKAAMRHREVPAGQPRRPNRPLEEAGIEDVRTLVDDALL